MECGAWKVCGDVDVRRCLPGRCWLRKRTFSIGCLGGLAPVLGLSAGRAFRLGARTSVLWPVPSSAFLAFSWLGSGNASFVRWSPVSTGFVLLGSDPLGWFGLFFLFMPWVALQRSSGGGALASGLGAIGWVCSSSEPVFFAVATYGLLPLGQALRVIVQGFVYWP